MRPLAEAGYLVFVSIAPMLGPVTLPADFLFNVSACETELAD